MKKSIFFAVIFVIALLGIYSETQFSWCSRIFSNDSSLRIMQKSDYLRLLSQQYYGTSKFWMDLALVNRIADRDRIYPGEKIIIPDRDAIQKLHATHSMTILNEIVSNQKGWLAEHKVESTHGTFFEKPS
jgi:hypothetical protein